MTDLAIVAEASALWKSYGSVEALRGLDLTVPAGSVMGFLGPNGAGKTTTLRMLVGLAAPDRGSVRAFGVDPRATTDVRRRIGYLPGELQLDERLAVGEVLSLWAAVRGSVEQRYVDRLCERLALDPTRRTRGLSSGNRRKVGLVGAFMGRPDLLVLDEPTSGIDPIVQAEFGELVREVQAEGQTVLLSSHVLSEVQHLASEVTLIRSGETALTGSLDDLRQRARQPFSAWFRGEPPMAELTEQPGLDRLEVRGRQVSGVFSGSPDALVRVLAGHPLDHLLLPEPDLEDVVLQYYETLP